LFAFEGPVWLWPAAGGLLGLSLLALRPALPTAVWIGAALLATSGLIAGQSAPDLLAYAESDEEVPFYDLTKDPLGDEVSGRVRVRGHLLAEPKLIEYAVAEGENPDQNSPPHATVRLFLPTPDFAVPNEGRYLAARVLTSQGSTRQDGADVVEGSLRPLPDELVRPLFGGNPAPEGSNQGMLLDAAETASSGDVAMDIGLTLLAAFLALMAWRNAFAREEEAAPEPA
jgi:hypothetical protein